MLHAGVGTQPLDASGQEIVEALQLTKLVIVIWHEYQF
jgi:hypothetical protein